MKGQQETSPFLQLVVHLYGIQQDTSDFNLNMKSVILAEQM